MSLKYIHSPYRFFNSLNESIKTAKEYFFRLEKSENLKRYKENLIDKIRNGEEALGEGDPQEQISRIESGSMDRQLETMMEQDPSFVPEVEEKLNILFEKIKQNRTFGPNVLALPLTKMYIRYRGDDEHIARILDIVDILDDNKLKEFFKSRDIDLARLLDEFAEKQEEGGRPVYEMFTDYLTILQSEISANWLIKEFKTNAAMGRERNLPPFNQVEAFRKLDVNDPIRQNIISYAKQLNENRSDPVVAAAIKTIKDRLAGKSSMEEIAKWLGNSLNSALNESDDIKKFLETSLKVGSLVDMVYKDENKVVVVAHHELVLATLFPMAEWCILPSGWGGGRGMWNGYAGPSKNAIQFAVMDYSKEASNNMRCWAFSYNVNTKTVTHVHAKDDADILRNFPNRTLQDMFTEKPSITGSRQGVPVTYEDSNTFTLPSYELRELEESITDLYEKTVKFDSSFKLRDSYGSSITDFSRSSLFKAGGIMQGFVGYAAVKAKSKTEGVEIESFVSKHKNTLDMILTYLAADLYSAQYREKIKAKQPTLADTFILPFTKGVEGQSQPLVASGKELASYLISALKVSEKFKEETVKEIIKNLVKVMFLLNSGFNSQRSSMNKKFYLYQIEEAIGAFSIYAKSIGINSVPVGSKNKELGSLTVDDTEAIIKFIKEQVIN